jgi:hypothetical protein
MSKVTTKRLARGVRMLTGHVVGQLKTLLQEPQLAQISTDNLTEDKSTFRINLHVPVIKGQDTGAARALPVWIPFTLPPPQEYFTANMPDIDGNYPRPVLTEIGFSFDQRMEAAAITRFDSAVPVAEGKLSFDDATRLGVKISLYSKEMNHWSALSGGGITTVFRDKELTFDLPAAAFVNPRLRLNPAVQSNLSVAIEPLRTYLIEVDCAELTSAAGIPLQLNSVLVSLKFEQRLLGSDANYPGSPIAVQNMPTSHKGIIPTSAAAIVEPTTASEPIYADTGGTGTGIQASFETIDKFFQRLLRGGINKRGGMAATQQILQDAGYEVIAVPMFGNTEGIYSDKGGAPPVTNGMLASNMPYNPMTYGHLWDVRRIPIHFPFVLHHVLAVANYSPNKEGTNVTFPNIGGTNLIRKIGVGLGRGHFADSAGWESLAYAEYDNTTIANYVIDQAGANNGAVQQGLGFNLLSIPLVGSAANSSIGTGYLSNNGKPIFTGEAASPNEARSDLADGVSGSIPATRPLEGKEQWLEVRWQISDPTAKFQGANYQTEDILVGNGGNWVFLIGKKYLA